MKKKMILLMIGLLMSMSSCISGQNYSPTYTRVYYDYVITGVVPGQGYVNDGYYSYHIVGDIPSNVYWILTPCGDNIRLFNRSLVFQRWWKPSNTWIFYNHQRHHQFRPSYPHRHVYNRPPRPNRPHDRPHGWQRPSRHHNGGGHIPHRR